MQNWDCLLDRMPQNPTCKLIKSYILHLLCWPVFVPQITGELLPPPKLLIWKVSVVQDPIAAADGMSAGTPGSFVVPKTGSANVKAVNSYLQMQKLFNL